MEYICSDCPRRCGALRGEAPGGVCASPALPHITRAAAHYGEEPCISGTRGSGAIFFSGCNLRCVFCQNAEISRGCSGKGVDADGLRGIMLRLRDDGVHNINLVTPTHYARVIAAALDGLELGIPVVWNSSGYESVETLRRLEGLVQVYMPDYKYAKSAPARRYSAAADYPEAELDALWEKLFFLMFHDNITGTVVDPAELDATETWEEMEEGLARIRRLLEEKARLEHWAVQGRLNW